MTGMKLTAAGIAALSLCLGGCFGSGDDDKPTASIAPPPATTPPPSSASPPTGGKVNVGAGGTASETVKHGGGLFAYIPDDAKLKVADQSGVGGNGSTTTLAKDGSSITMNFSGKLEGGRTIGSFGKMNYAGANGELDYGRSNNPGAGKKGSDYSVELEQKAGTSFLKHSAYGFAHIFQGTVGNGTDGAFDDKKPVSAMVGSVFGGDLTAKSDMPAGVTANYQGSFEGFGFANDGSDNGQTDDPGIAGDVRLKANFSDGKVTGNVYNFKKFNDDGTSRPLNEKFGIAIDSKINAAAGNTFQGTAAIATPGATGKAVAGATTSSNVIGAFAGPKAAEAVGALQVHGKLPSGATPVFIQGSFGAVKK